MANTRKASTPTKNLLAVIQAAKLPEKQVPLCLRGDLVAQIEELEREIRETRTQIAAKDDRLVGNTQMRDLAAQIEQLREQMQASTVVFHLRALPRRKYQEFLAAHAPREGDKLDRAYGFNRDTYFDDLIKVCCYEPTLAELTDEEYAAFGDQLSAKQWDMLGSAAQELNAEDVTVPFSAAASLLLRNSNEK